MASQAGFSVERLQRFGSEAMKKERDMKGTQAFYEPWFQPGAMSFLFADTGANKTIRKQGWMFKKSPGWFKGYNKRYFILRNEKLFFFHFKNSSYLQSHC